MEKSLVDIMNEQVFDPLRVFMNREISSFKDLRAFINERGLPEKLRKGNQGAFYGHVLEEYFKWSLSEFRRTVNSDIVLRKFKSPEHTKEYRLESDEWGNIMVYNIIGNSVCEIDAVCEYSWRRIPIIFEVTSVQTGKKIHLKRKIVGNWYNQKPFSCKVKFYHGKRRPFNKKYNNQGYFKGTPIPHKPELEEIAKSLLEDKN